MNKNHDERDENKLHCRTFKNSRIDLGILSQPYEDLDIAASKRGKANDMQKHVSAIHIKPESSGLISTWSKCQELLNEIDKAYSLWVDQEESEKKKYKEKAILLHESRKGKM